MRTDVAYEIIQFNPDNYDRIGMLRPIPDGLVLVALSGMMRHFILEDLDEQLVDDEMQGIVEIRTKTERVVLNQLTLESWNEMAPFFKEAPEFESDVAVNEFFSKLIREHY